MSPAPSPAPVPPCADVWGKNHAPSPNFLPLLFALELFKQTPLLRAERGGPSPPPGTATCPPARGRAPPAAKPRKSGGGRGREGGRLAFPPPFYPIHIIPPPSPALSASINKCKWLSSVGRDVGVRGAGFPQPQMGPEGEVTRRLAGDMAPLNLQTPPPPRSPSTPEQGHLSWEKPGSLALMR